MVLLFQSFFHKASIISRDLSRGIENCLYREIWASVLKEREQSVIYKVNFGQSNFVVANVSLWNHWFKSNFETTFGVQFLFRWIHFGPHLEYSMSLCGRIFSNLGILLCEFAWNSLKCKVFRLTNIYKTVFFVINDMLPFRVEEVIALIVERQVFTTRSHVPVSYTHLTLPTIYSV